MFCIRIRSEERDPNRWKAALTNDRCCSIAQLFHPWLSVMWQTPLRRDRSHLRSAIASVVQLPFLKFPFRKPRGAPGLRPPCKRHRLRPRMAGRWHAVPVRVLAPHLGACLRFLSRVSRSWSMRLPADFCCPPAAFAKFLSTPSLADLASEGRLLEPPILRGRLSLPGTDGG